MIGRISVAALTLCIGACASSGPTAPAPAAMAPSGTVDTVASDQPASPPEAGAQEVASASSEYDPNEVICRREKEAGSNFYKKTCYTRAQLDARAEEDKEALRQMRHMRSGSQSDIQGDGG